MSPRVLQQFGLLVYKNFKLQLRRPVGTFVELFLPIGGVVFIVVMRNFLHFRKESKCFTTSEPDPLRITEQPALNNPNYSGSLYIYYAPYNFDTRTIMNIAYREIVGVNTVQLKLYPHDSEKDVLKSLKNFDEKATKLNICYKKGTGIIFQSLHGDKMSYKIRLSHEVGPSNSWKTIQTSPNYDSPGPRGTNLYLSEGFLQLQKYIGNAMIKWRANKEGMQYNPVDVYVRQFPYPEYYVDTFLAKVNIIIPLLFMLTFLYSAGIIVKELVLEKETKIRESMLMMGLTVWVLWASWFVKQFVFLLIPVVVITCLVKFFLFQHSNGFLLFLFFVLYIVSLISFSFLISVWFDSARLGLVVGFIAWFGSFCPFIFLIFRYRITHFGLIMISCAISNTAFGFGIEIIARLEQQTVGLQWDNIIDPITVDDSFNMVWLLGMLSIDSLFYLVLTWYVNAIKPGNYGVAKPFYFPLLSSYWCATRKFCGSKFLQAEESFGQDDPTAHEKVRGKLTAGIRIRNLTKTYSTFGSKGPRKKAAVNKLSFDAYKGHITALLGHNGAGKTTTMSILTGLLTPTEGNAFINGYSIITDMDNIRKSLGICPQHNVLFDRLTVREHLQFFMLLKGISDRNRIKEEVENMVEDLMLSGKGNVKVSQLSGGMKRKLSVAIALIGGSEIVILDEPTAGMDPYARRATWDLLGKYKQNRCILMSTHLMDEADLLGDRIAIMAEGKLCCSGSSLFLKSRYGVGYHMTLVKGLNCTVSEIESLVNSFIPSAKKVTDIGMELSFILPLTEACVFPDLFDEIEDNKETLGIASFGISITTMEEVFLKVGEDLDKALKSSMFNKRSIVYEAVKLKERNKLIQSLKPAIRKSKGKNKKINPHSIGTDNAIRKNMNDHMQSQPINSNRNYNLSKMSPDKISTSGHIIMNGISTSSHSNMLRDLKHQRNYSNKVAPLILDENVLCSDPRNKSGKSFTYIHGEDKIEENILKELDTSVLSHESKNICSVNVSDEVRDLSGRVRDRNVIFLPPLSPKLPKVDFSHLYTLLGGHGHPLPSIKNAGKDSPMKHDYELNSSHNSSNSFVCHYIPNGGIKLWLQQFRAMFVKKLCYSARFYPSLFVQLFFPVFFMAIGLLVVLTHPQYDDPPRILDISTSSFHRRNTTVFYAELDQTSMNFSRVSAKELSVTEYIDITASVNDLKNEVKHTKEVDDCCNYEYQLLDKFCASRNAVDLEHCANKSNAFAYSSCLFCLKCCAAYRKPNSCTYPSTKYLPTAKNCPSPPSLSLYSNTIGPLDTTNTYVMEYILRLAKKIGAVPFFRTYQAGFTIARQEPLISLCDCAKVEGKSARGCSIFEGLQESRCNRNDPCPVFRVGFPGVCPLRPFNETLCRKEPTCFKSDIFSVDIIEFFVCHNGDVDCKLVPHGQQQQDIEFILSSNKRAVSRVHPEYLPTAAVTVWYNNGGYHMSAAAFNTFQNIYLKLLTKNDNLSMEVINHPLPRDLNAVAQDVVGDFTGFGLSILGLFGYSFFLANYVIFLVKEKESKAKHVQFVSGVSATSYWFAALTWDLINSCLPVGLTIVVFQVFPVTAYHGTAITALLLVLILTCWASIPFTYVVSFIFSSSLAAFSALLSIFFLISVGLLTSVFLIHLFGRDNRDKVADLLHHLFLMSPTYGLATTLSDIFVNKQIMDFCMQNYNICNHINLTYIDDPLVFERPGVGATCIYLLVQGFVYITLVLLLELQFFVPYVKRSFIYYIKSKASSHNALPQILGEDEDVYMEKKRVRSGGADGDTVVINDLVKVYHNCLGCSLHDPKVAVDGVSVGIGTGECFGLLGVNGAGKTTTFSILTGEINATSGTAIIADKDIRTSLKAVRQGLGYCPQFDALIDCMTARELLWMYARLRGVPEDCIKQVVDNELHRLDLVKYAMKKCGKYSGGVKRKLSTAIAMIGNPPIILLDEPSNGMDPSTRRYLWNVLTKLTEEGKSIILTSHSMEECEALCTRLAIMVNGQFKCLGSIQHLKNKYGSGITLQVKVKQIVSDSNHEQIDYKNKIQRLFSNPASSQPSVRRRSHFFSMHYNRSRASSLLVGSLFPSLRGSQTSLDMSDYCDTAALHAFIRRNFRGSILLEEHFGAVTYLLPSSDLSWSSIFRLLEEHKEELGIIDYSVSQTTLEQVFINFAKEQYEQCDYS